METLVIISNYEMTIENYTRELLEGLGVMWADRDSSDKPLVVAALACYYDAMIYTAERRTAVLLG